MNSFISKITPVIITKDSETHLNELLDSLKIFSNIVIYDNGSTDRTIDIAKQYKNVNVHIGYFDGFGSTKNRAASLSPTDWIFSLDSDEIPDRDLLEEISNINTEHTNMLYQIERCNLFLEKPVKHSGWSPDRLIRIYNRTFTSFTSVPVHESILVPNSAVVDTLNGKMKHYAVERIEDFLLKTARYSQLTRPGMKKISPLFIFLRASFAFFKTYILKFGFIDGARGLTIAVSNFNGVFFKYMHLYFESQTK